MREIFTRVEESSSVSIEVVLDADQYRKDYAWLFSVFVKFDALDQSQESYEAFLETKESLIIAVEYEERTKYIGSRIIDGWTELYFCASSGKELDSMVTAILKDTGFAYESNIIKDKKWNFYDLQLFPTELEFAHIQSEKIIFLLEEEGDDLSVARDVEHYISFKTPTQKEKFLTTLDFDGFSFKDEISSDEFENGIALVKHHSVTKEEVDNIVDALFTKIKEHQGYYEGWSTTLVEDSKE